MLFMFFVVVQSLSCVWFFATPLTAARQAPLSLTVSWSLFEIMSIELIMLSNHLFLCRSLLLLPSVFPNIRVFSSELALLISWPKYWSFSFNISPFSEYSRLIFFKVDWNWSPCSPRNSQKSSPAPQLEGINFSVLSLLYGPTLTSIYDYWKNHSFDYTDFVSKVISLLFNMLSMFVIVFLSRRKCLLFHWLQSSSAVILGPQKRISVTVATFSPSICHEVMGLYAMILIF